MATELGQAYVQIVPSARGIGKSISDSIAPESEAAGEKAGISIASKIKGAIVAAGIGLAIGKIVKASVGAGSELEQSIGGIETLFGAGGRSLEEYAKKIGKSTGQAKGEYKKLMEAQNLALKNADKAYKTAGVSANDYMQNVSSFAASLKQSLGGDVVKAAKIADLAMIDMSDNANKMGTDIASIQNAYQGFAKQNYTMLDNLKLGYGGTKAEMERLLKDAQKFSGVKYDISNLADVYEAIHVIQSELDITGTTAKEASETISGSANAMKAAFENVLGKLAIGENIDAELKALAETVSVFLFNNLIPMIIRILGALPGAVATFIQEAVPLFIEQGRKLLSSLSAGIGEGMPEFLTFIPNLIMDLLLMLGQELPKLAESGRQLINNIITGLKENLPLFVESAKGLITDFIYTIADNLPTIIESGVQIVTNLISGLLQSIPLIAQAALDILTHFGGVIIEVAPDLITRGQDMVGKLISGVSQTAPKLLEKVIKLMKDLLSKISEKLPDFLKNGADFIVKMINGIASKAPEIIGKIFTLISSLISTIAKNLPSFLAKGAEIVGKLIVGIAQALPRIVASIMNLALRLIRALIQNMPKFLKAGLDLILGLGRGLIQAIPGLVSKVPQLISGIIGALRNGLIGIYNIGREIVSGIWKGISGGVGWLYGKVKGFASGLVSKVKGFFKIKSPSRVFRNEIGSMLGKGLGLGIEDEVGTVSQAMDKLEAETLRDMNGSYSMEIDTGLNSSVDMATMKLSDELTGNNKEPLLLKLILGSREFRAFVEDITKQQDKDIELGLSY